MEKILLIILLIVLMFGLMGSSPLQQIDPVWDESTHYLIFEKTTSRGILPLYHRVVRLSAPMQSSTTPALGRALSSPQRNHQFVVVRLKDLAGRVLFQGAVQKQSVLRGEFHGDSPGDMIDGHFFPLESIYFVVRVPVIERALLHIWDPQTRSTQVFDLGLIPINEFDDSIRNGKVERVAYSGNPQNRVDLLVMGDGYREAERELFDTDLQTITSNFFGITPLAEYQNYFNVHTLFIASNESGANHPPYDPNCAFGDNSCCGDPAMIFDPLVGTMVDTAFDATYCAYSVHRLLVVDIFKVYSAAEAVPDWDIILMIVNDETYGGSGGNFTVVSTHPAVVDLAQHEFGHNFANLADEYPDPYPGYPGCSDISGSSPCEVNVTDDNSPGSIKWANWFLPSTPIPTVPEWDPGYATVVGLFDGARYQFSGMFRSGQNCLMRSLGQPFCQVPSQAIVLKYYHGGWGIPWEGISMIEPNSTTPSRPDVKMQVGTVLDFSVNILSPILGPPPSVNWFHNGTWVLAGVDSFNFAPSVGDYGLNTIRLEVMDMTPLVLPDVSGSALSFIHDWTVEVVPTRFNHSIYLPLIQQ